MSSTKFVFFGQIGKTRWPPWPLIGWDIFNFSSETAERNSTKLYRKQDFKVIYQVCVFRADWKNKMAAMASDWLRHFRLLLWNCLTEFNDTWQEARSQRPLPHLSFSYWSEKQDGRPDFWLVETFSTSPLKPLNGFQRNLTGSKISTSSTKFVCFGPISKQKGPPWSITLKGGTLYLGARYVARWASCCNLICDKFNYAYRHMILNVTAMKLQRFSLWNWIQFESRTPVHTKTFRWTQLWKYNHLANLSNLIVFTNVLFFVHHVFENKLIYLLSDLIREANIVIKAAPFLQHF